MRRQSGSLIPEASWSSNTEDDILQLPRRLLRALFTLPRTRSFEKQGNPRRHGPLARSVRTTKASWEPYIAPAGDPACKGWQPPINPQGSIVRSALQARYNSCNAEVKVRILTKIRCPEIYGSLTASRQLERSQSHDCHMILYEAQSHERQSEYPTL